MIDGALPPKVLPAEVQREYREEILAKARIRRQAEIAEHGEVGNRVLALSDVSLDETS